MNPVSVKMVRDDLRLGLRHCRGTGRATHSAMRRCRHLPPALEQALVGRVLHQRVFETVDGIRRIAAAKHKLRVLKLGERVLQGCLIAPSQRVHQRIGELAPDDGADLADLLHRCQAVQPRH